MGLHKHSKMSRLDTQEQGEYTRPMRTNTQKGKATMYTIQRLYTKNDSNGNPRRVFLVYGLQKGEMRLHGVYEEGYLGRQAVPQEIRDNASTYLDVEITPREYRRLLKLQA